MTSSLMNSDARVDPNNWAITLTCDIDGLHAKLIFEGMKNESEDSYFCRFAHLIGKSNSVWEFNCNFSYVGEVELTRKFNRNKFDPTGFFKQTKTWVRSREKIKRLIVEIKAETTRGYPFSLYGSKSLFAKKTEIFEIYNPLLAYIEKENRDLFLCLYDSAQNGGECTGMNRKDFDDVISRVLSEASEEGRNEYTYPTLIKMILECTEKSEAFQNSCFTWAREKLKILDIELTDIFLESIISITHLYTDYKPGQKAPVCSNYVIDKEEEKLVRKWKDRKLYGSFVTYSTNRDCRTEEWKRIEKRNNFNQRVSKVALCVGAFGTAAGVLGLLALPVLVAFGAPVVAVSAVVGGTGVMALEDFVQGKLKKSQEALIRIVSENERLKQPGNNSARVCALVPGMEDLRMKLEEYADSPCKLGEI